MIETKVIFFVFALMNFVLMLFLLQKKKYRDLAKGLAIVEILLVYFGISL